MKISYWFFGDGKNSTKGSLHTKKVRYNIITDRSAMSGRGGHTKNEKKNSLHFSTPILSSF